MSVHKFMRPLLFLLTATYLFAQDATDFRIELQVLESRAYRQSEVIPVSLRVSGLPERHDVPPPLPQERPGVRWQFSGFLVDPPLKIGEDLCGTQEKPCFLRGGVMSGPAEVDFNRTVGISSATLNDYTERAIPPGRYRVSALARKLVLTSAQPMGASYGPPNPPASVVSNVVELQIVPATAEWIGQAISNAVAALRSGKQVRNSEDYQRERSAAKQLAFLDTPAAWSAVLDLLPIQDSLLLSGLASTSQPGQACDLMQARIGAPAQAVTSTYLSTLTSVCTRANVPPLPPVPVANRNGPAGGITGAATGVIVSSGPFNGGRLGAAARAPDPEMQAYFEKQRAYVEELKIRSTGALAASLAGKQGGAPTVEAIKALLGYVRELQYGRPRGAMPGWTAELAAAVVSSLPSMNRDERLAVLPLFATTLPAASAASAFEAVMNEWKPNTYREEAEAAFKALYKVDPRRAKERIVAELKKEQTWLEPSMLGLLPAKDAPAMDDGLLDGPLSMLRASAIARYATPQALPKVRALYEAQTNRCQPELVAYFLRVDEAYAIQAMRSTATPACLPQYFQRTAALIMTPAFEAFIVPYLMNASVYLKSEAAKSLGKYGAATAQKPLWDTLRYFHEYWDGKGAELAKNGEGLVLEEQLAMALTRGRAWVLSEPDLRKVQDLCIGERCLYLARQDLGQWMSPPLRLEVFEEGNGFRGTVAQYYPLDNLAEMEAKLAQFPSGTTFMMWVSGPSYETIEASLRSVASSKGLVLQTR